MKKMYKSLLSIVLAVAMLFTSQTFNMTVMAASAATSTDAIDGAEETTIHIMEHTRIMELMTRLTK